MDYYENFHIGLKSIKQHKMRSLLTTLGVIFGVAAVIAMMSIAGGAKKTAIEQIKLLGTNNVRVKHLQLSGDKKLEAEYRGTPGLNLHDVEMIEKNVPGVEAVAPLKFYDSEIFHGNLKTSAKIVGTNDRYDNVVNFHPQNGRFITPLDIVEAKRVCVLGADIARELFQFRNPVGEQVRIQGSYYTVVGVMESKKIKKSRSTIIEIRNINRDVYIPITTVLHRFLTSEMYNQLDEIAVRFNDPNIVIPASQVLNRLLYRLHFKVQDYDIVIPTELLAQSQKTQRIFNIVMGSIAAISLLVGGIGIMNIMLATVTERTREIGIRRAIGASETDIMLQFLNETVLISVTGGIIGIILGGLMAQAITLYANWDTVISLFSIVIAFGISVLVGIVFGLYPARKAARMDPIQALRTE